MSGDTPPLFSIPRDCIRYATGRNASRIWVAAVWCPGVPILAKPSVVDEAAWEGIVTPYEALAADLIAGVGCPVCGRLIRNVEGFVTGHTIVVDGRRVANPDTLAVVDADTGRLYCSSACHSCDPDPRP